MGKRQKLVNKIARQVLSSEGYRPSMHHTSSGSVQIFWKRVEEIVWRTVRHMRPETLGIIGCSGLAVEHAEPGRVTLTQVHGGDYMSLQDGGKKLLQYIAATTIVAEMWSVLLAEGKVQPRSAV